MAWALTVIAATVTCTAQGASLKSARECMNIISAYRHRVMRAFRRAGIDADRARGALVHGLRHTFATELANADVSVYALMKPLGHESIATSQRYITAAGSETRTAASQTDSMAC